MVFFNYALRKLNAKIVYYGPGLCGKTTNLVWIHDHFEGGERGKMISLATEGDRTIFFDLLPLEIGSIRGMEVTLQLYTVPGQVHYNSTRQLVLRGADGVVFVADSQRAMQSSNIDSFKNLQENLLLQGISLDGFPHVLQFNKRDLKNLVTIEELNDDLNHYSVPIFEAVATEGVGVQETLEGIVKLVMRNLRQRYEGATTGARTPGVEDPHVRVPDIPLTPPPGPSEVVPRERIAFADEPTSVEGLSEPPPEEGPAPLEEPLGPAILEPMMPDDPAKTIDFSRSMGADAFQEPGAGFEDEVSTGVYDVDDDSAIDFEELKRLDAPIDVPEPPPAEEIPGAADRPLEEETPVADELPPGAPPEAEVADTVAGAELPEIPDGVPSAFDLESTDAGLKTQELSRISDDLPLEDFDFDALPPDMDAVPDFELDEGDAEPLLEAEPEPEVVTDFEAEPTEIEFDAPGVGVDPFAPPAEKEAAHVTEGTAAEEIPQVGPPQRPATEGAYVDRIKAPGPFAPDAEAPREAPDVLEALRTTAEAEEAAPEAPPMEPVLELPPEEPLEEPIGEEPVLAPVDEPWKDRGEPELVAEPAGDEVPELPEREAWEEPAVDEPAAEAAPAEEPVEHTFPAEPTEEPVAELDQEAWKEHTVEEMMAEQPVAKFTSKAGGEPTPEQLLAEFMGADSVVRSGTAPTRESAEQEAVADAMAEEESVDAFSPEEPEVVADISEAAAEKPPIEEGQEAFETPVADEAEGEERAAAAEELDAGPSKAAQREPVVVGGDDPWTEEELSDVYRISEVEKAEQAAAIEAATPRAVSVQAEDNQLHLRLQGTGAIVESGQVRALDIEVPVPGSWVGNKRVTLQLRLTLTPDLEDEDGGPGSPS